MKYEKCFLHVDLDAFFASVEQLDHPEWRGKPVIVGGLPGEPRSVVSTASYEARKFGVHSAMPVSMAYRLCPKGIYTHGHYERYSELSEKVMEILKKYSPDINRISIDEASVDITGTELLFGKPEEIASKIRREVFETTGLTVSIGLASNRYLAKIASEINKPDGFYQIQSGSEEEFMLSLPLEKVWGIGDKTLEKLNRAGFRTTRDIHAQKQDLLQKLFGDSTGLFLYNCVRGIQNEQKTSGNHSISAETTFPVDISDLYIAETKLMELCHIVLFRMKSEKVSSRTITIKLRYDDFSTISVQGTEEEYIASLDDLYEKARRLFEKKYEKGRPIRLLGVGVDNLVSEDYPKQEMLFDFGAKKKKALEDAILNLKKKHPEIELKKARILDGKKFLVPLFFSLAALFPQKTVHAEEIRIQEADRAAAMENPDKLLPVQIESARTLFDRKIGKAEMEFLARGYWEGNAAGTLTLEKDSEGWDFAAGTPVFRQQVDLSVFFMLNRQWYFEADFADEFKKNTVAAGFYGKESNPLKEVRIANRGIEFPAGYSIDLFSRGIGGGDNQAPGLFMHFEDPREDMKKWKADFAMRYDMTEQHYALYYGKNSVSTSNISPASYIAGQFFVLPEESGLIDKIRAVYVESSGGSYTDNYGRKFKKLAEDMYLIQKNRSTLVLSKDAGGTRKNSVLPSIIVEFTEEPKESDFGSYSDSSSFLGKIQEFFGKEIDLSSFGYKIITEMSGRKMLLIQNSTGFSPFTIASRYDLGIVSNAAVLVASSTTEQKAEGYNITITDDFETLLNSSFYSQTHTYAEVYTDTKTYSGAPGPEERYPLAGELPGFYLGYTEKTDITIQVQNFTPVKNYDIGTDAASASVRVYKNSILDSGAKYDRETGTVTLSSAVSDSDKIYITWNQDSGNAEEGAVAAQAAFAFTPNQFFTWDFSAAANWTVNPYREYAEYGRPSQGYVTGETGISIKKGGFSFSNAVAGTLENRNVTGLYRADGMENAKITTYYLSEKSGFLLKNGIIPKISGLDLLAENNRTENTENTKGLSDSLITGYKIPLEWSFPESETSALYWAAENVKLSAGWLLSSGTEFRIALKNETFNETDFDLYLQLGTEASDDPKAEYSDKIPCWKLTGNTTDAVKTGFIQSTAGWQIIRIALTDSDRSCFQSCSDARLIVTGKTKSSGIICAGPYEIVTEGIFTKSDEKLNVSSEQIKDNFIPDRKTFNENNENYVQKIEWNASSGITTQEETVITAAKYFKEADLSAYKKAELLFKYEYDKKDEFSGNLDKNNSQFKIQLDRESTSINSDGKIALLACLNGEALKILQMNRNYWHRLSLDMEERTVEIDGMKIPEENVLFFLNDEIVPTRIKLEFSTLDMESRKLTRGSLSIDELSFSETTPSVLVQDTAELKLEKKGEILKKGNTAIIEDASFKSRHTASVSIKADESDEKKYIQQNSTSASVTITGIKLEADLALSSAEYNLLSSLSQKISSAKPVLKVMSFSDQYIFNHADTSLEKNSEIKLNFSEFKVPLALYGNAKSRKNRWALTSRAEEGFELIFEQFHNLTVKGGMHTEQSRSPSSSDVTDIEDETYLSGYADTTKESFSTGSQDAEKRIVDFSALIGMNLLFLNLAPQLSFKAQEKYSVTSSVKYTDIFTLEAEIPFCIKNQNFTFRYTREGGGTLLMQEAGGTYGTDYSMLRDNFSSHDFFFRAFAAGDLFSSREKNTMSGISESDPSTESLNYSGKYYFSWKRPVFADIRDLYIPSNFTFSATRSIVTSGDTSDTYVYSATLLNTPMNLFGSMSRYRLFSFYKTDEYILSLTGNAKIPVESPADRLLSLSAYLSSGFFMNENDVLRAGMEVKMQTDESWSAETSMNYKRRTGFSPIISICRLICPKYDWSAAVLTRTNALDAKISRSDEITTQKYELSHKLSMEFSGLITINLGTALSASYKDSTQVLTLNLTGTAGGKISF